MVKQIGDRAAIVSSKELGTNCWLARRFVKDGSRCARLYVCKYSERKTCEAVNTEIAHLKNEQIRMANVIVNIDHTIGLLAKMLEK